MFAGNGDRLVTCPKSLPIHARLLRKMRSPARGDTASPISFTYPTQMNAASLLLTCRSIDRTTALPRDPKSQPIPPSARRDLTVKQQRDARRAEKVAALKKQQASEKRKRTIGIVLASVAGAAVLGLIIMAVITSGTPRQDPEDIEIEGLQTYSDLSVDHVEGPVVYEQSPPVGGDHAPPPLWLNCGIYTEPVPNENAVHSLEHGAVWVTYDAEEITGDELATLQGAVPDTYSIVSPYPDLQAPVVLSAWGAQLELDSVNDPRIQPFVDKFWQGPTTPERGAACNGGVDAPGKVA